MSDLGSKAALQADIDAKVTTNGNGENTGARVRAALTNMVDTLSNGENLSVTPYLYVTAGDNATGIYQKVGTANGKNWYRNVDAPGEPTLADPDYSVIWDDPGTGLQWNVTDADAGGLFASTSDVATPDLATGWTVESGATGPAPSIAGYPGPTVQDVLEQIAADVSVLNLTQYGKYRGKRTFSGATDTLVLADAGGLVLPTNNGSITITVPPQGSVAFPELVTITCFPNSSAGQITFAPGSGVTLLSGGGALKTAMPLGGVALTLIDALTNTWWVEGNLTV